MNLPQRNQGPAFAVFPYAQLLEEERPIPFNRRARVVRSKAKVQRVAAVNSRHAAAARGKCMYQPGKLR
jgi:hypothetical protein